MKSIRTDEDGCIVINPKLIGLVTLIILILSTVGSVVAYSVGVKSTVEFMTEKVSYNEENIKNIDERLIVAEQEIAVMKEHYNHIDKSLDEIKEKLK